MKKKPQKTPTSKSADPMRVLLVLLKQVRYAEGEALARELTTHFAQNGVCWKALGVMLLLQGKHAKALEPMQKAARLLPGDAETHSNLGVTFRELDRLPEAEASLRRALIIKPDYAEAHNNLGNVLSKMPGRLDDAVAQYEQALRLQPDNATIHFNLAVALLKVPDRGNEAVAHLREVVRLQPGNYAARQILARIGPFEQ